MLHSCDTQGAGLCVIVNQKTFPTGLQDRLGTDRDRDELAATFTLFQGDVLIYDNKSAKDMMVDLKLAAHKADSNPSYRWVVVCVLTHGRRVDNVDQVLGSDGEGVDRKQIVNMFANAQLCPNLHKKPKVFIFQVLNMSKRVSIQIQHVEKEPCQPKVRAVPT